jgi:formylglycine-generating enzyme required for sulfatase activity/outer membrane protein assembly factor BamB/dienelactone hydrolase
MSAASHTRRTLSLLASLTAVLLLSLTEARTAAPTSAAQQIQVALEKTPGDKPPIPPSFPFDAATARKYQQQYSDWSGLPLELIDSAGIQFVLVPPGEFQMGSPEDEPGHSESSYDETLHPVRLTRPFYLSRYETTVGQFARFVQSTGFLTDGEKNGGGNAHDDRAVWKHRPGTSWRKPGFAGPFELSDRQPIVHVSHFDARMFCRWLRDSDPAPDGLPPVRYGLPTEAQWEWACRAGAGTRFAWGSDVDDTGRRLNVGDERLKHHQPKWPRETMPMSDGFAFPAPVGRYEANAFGLHDMLGNVWEFCSTHYGPYPRELSVDPGDLDPKRGFAVRGGGWSNSPNDVRCATRNADPPHFCHSNLGFRVSIQLPPIGSSRLPADDSRRVLPLGELPDDTRMGPLNTERAEFPFQPPASADAWQTRKADVRRTMLVSMGLWPLPKRTPLNEVIHGAVDCGEYTVEKVQFESVPGFFVTGNLYRPKNVTGKGPAVLSPHGHFPGGRFQDAGADSVRRSIASGAERFEEGGRSFMQSRCVQLARMGCVVLLYDMIGYGDSQQLALDLVHRFSRTRLKFSEAPEPGFYSAAAENWLHNPLGLHTWNSIRALDFLTGLPDVDPDRVAVTGGSGGGTQSFLLCAVDDRPLVSVPVVIVSTARQGGCTCENISHFHLDTFNLEMNALHAPKPLLMVSADDASRTMNLRGFPELRQHYGLFGMADRVEHEAYLHFPHNYNFVSRTAMYGFVNRHLKLGLEGPILERPYNRLTHEQSTVWNDDHPRPDTKPDYEQLLLDQLTDAAREQIAQLHPKDAESFDRYREIVGGAWSVLLRSLPENAGVSFDSVRSVDHDLYRETLGLIRYRTFEKHDAELPVVRLDPKAVRGQTVVWITPNGKAGLFEESGAPRPPVQKLLDSGRTVIGVDLLHQGEFLCDGRPINRQRSLPGEEAFAGWTYCYNLTTFARRTHDVLATIAWAGNQGTTQVELIGLAGAGHIASAAAAQAGDSLSRVAIHTNGFRFAAQTDVYHVDFLPGAARYNDLPGLLSLAAPDRMWLAGEDTAAVRFVSDVWTARGSGKLTLAPDPNDADADAVRWLISSDPPQSAAVPHKSEDWPRWRGPRGDGTWRTVELPARWPDGGLRQLWRQPIGGGHGGVAAADGRVYLMDRQTEPREVERVLCFDAATGDRLWTHEYSVSYGKLDYGNGPRSTPTVFDGRVYTFGSIGHVFCLDAGTGAVLWQREYPLDTSKKIPMWGLAASPVIDGDNVIIHPGAEPNGCLIALNRTTGAEIWRNLSDPSGYATPILIERGERREIICWTPKHIHGLLAETGESLWSIPHDVTYGVSIVTPIYSNGIVFVSGYWEGAQAIRLGTQPHDAELIWEDNSNLRGVMSQPLSRGDHAWMVDKGRGLTCFELATGKKLWDAGHQMTPRGRNPQANLVWLNDSDRAIVLNSDGELILARLSTDGYEEQSRCSIIGPTWAHPAFAWGRVFARNDEELICVPITE